METIKKNINDYLESDERKFNIPLNIFSTLNETELMQLLDQYRLISYDTNDIKYCKVTRITNLLSEIINIYFK